MKKEIEVKAKVADLKRIQKQLEQFGCVFTEPAVDEDTYFVNFSSNFAVFMPKTNFLRIRKSMLTTETAGQKSRILFTLKQPQANELDCIQKETEITDAEEMRGALELMGYHEVVAVRKIRTKTRYNDMEICFDEVDGLGTFVEVEKITECDAEVTQEELFVFLETLGVKREDRVVNGYDTLVYMKNNSK